MRQATARSASLSPDSSTHPSSVLLTVVVPCYNEQDAVADTVHQLQSVLASVDSFEIIVVDDGSTDRTGEILDALSSENASLRLIKHTRNRGLWRCSKERHQSFPRNLSRDHRFRRDLPERPHPRAS